MIKDIDEVTELRLALEKCRDALVAILTCHACGRGVVLGYAEHCQDCSAHPDAKDEEVDMDKLVQAAWQAATDALIWFASGKMLAKGRTP